MTKILKGRPVAKQIFNNIKKQLEQTEIQPKLVILIIGNDPAAEFYVSNLEKKGRKVGIEVSTIKLGESIDQTELLAKIQALNSDKFVHGIMVQKPLPKQIDENTVNLAINPDKDMDAFHPINLGKMLLNQDGFLPSTPAAVLEILKYYEIETSGKEIAILGRSDIVGKPLANLLLRKNTTGNATVTVCHSRTKNLKNITKNADILIVGIGKAEYVNAEFIREKCVVIDVGVNQIEDPIKGYKYVGDVDYENCFEKASMITPVPGGVGTVTTAMLLQNVLKSYKNKIK